MARRIDAHQHFWQYRAETHGWIDDSMRVLRGDFMPDDLAPLLVAAGFDSCIAVQTQQNVAETEWLLELAAAHPFIAGVVGWVDLRAGDVTAELRRLSASKKLRGVRHVVQDEPDDRFLLQPEFMRGIGMLAEFGLAYDILVYPGQLPAAVELTRAFPEQRFVLDHLGKPEIRTGGLDGWARSIAAISRNRNVYCKLSGMVTEADWRTWSPDALAPYVQTVLDWFGPERLMIGSDWPVCLLAGTYETVVGAAMRLIDRLPQRDQDAILGGTAARVYGV